MDFPYHHQVQIPRSVCFHQSTKSLVFFMYLLFKDNQELRQISWIIVEYSATQEKTISEERQRTKRLFRTCQEMYQKDIKPKFRDLLDNCAVISGQDILSNQCWAVPRIKIDTRPAITNHLQNLYEFRFVGEWCGNTPYVSTKNH